mgnify:CR=1 FL=1
MNFGPKTAEDRNYADIAQRKRITFGLLISEGKKPDPFIILCLGSYKPLYSYKWSQLISLPGQYEKVSKTLINDFFTEKTLSSEIPTLQEVTDKISYDVRQQYEENPYPKWTSIKLNPEPLPFDEIIKRFRLKQLSDWKK